MAEGQEKPTIWLFQRRTPGAVAEGREARSSPSPLVGEGAPKGRMRGAGQSAASQGLSLHSTLFCAVSFLPTPLIRLGATRRSTFSHKGRRQERAPSRASACRSGDALPSPGAIATRRPARPPLLPCGVRSGGRRPGKANDLTFPTTNARSHSYVPGHPGPSHRPCLSAPIRARLHLHLRGSAHGRARPGNPHPGHDRLAP